MKIDQIIAINESQQIDELSFKDIQKGAGKIAKGAQKFQKNVAQTGDAVAGAANAIGGAGAELAKQTIARPVGAAYNAVKGAAGAAANTVANTYGDVKKGVQNVGQGIATAQSDLGNAAKFAGQRAADAIGGAAGAVGAVASVPQGVGRAVKGGYNAGVQAIGGPDKDAQQNATQPTQAADQAQGSTTTGAAQSNVKIAALQKQIAQKQKELSELEGQMRMAQQETGSTDQQVASGGTQPQDSNKFAAGMDALSAAVNKGVGMGTSGSSLAHRDDASMQTVKDQQGKEHKYKQVGDKWIDMATNQPVDPATSAMLANQAATTQAATTPAAAPVAQEPMTIGGQKLDPNKPADAKIIAQVQQQVAAPASARIANDVQARMAKQLGTVKQNGINTGVTTTPSASAPAAQNFKQQPAGSYGATTMNAPTGIPQVGGIQPTTGAKVVPTQKPATAPAKQPEMAGTDFSAMLVRKAKVKL